jgi:Mg2+-importing ATPase
VHTIVTKGAMVNVLDVCTFALTAQGVVDIALVRDQIQDRFQELSSKGFRVLGLSNKIVDATVCLTRDEAEMTFLGFLVFFDPPKEGIAETIRNLNDLRVALKVITGDNRLVAASIVLLGQHHVVPRVALFAENYRVVSCKHSFPRQHGS